MMSIDTCSGPMNHSFSLSEKVKQMLHAGKYVLIRPSIRECVQVTNHEMCGNKYIHMYNWIKKHKKNARYYLVRSYYRDFQRYRLRWDGVRHTSELSELLIHDQQWHSTELFDLRLQSVTKEKLTSLSFDPVQRIDGQETHLVLRCMSSDKSWTAEFWIRCLPNEQFDMKNVSDSQSTLQNAFTKRWNSSRVMNKMYVYHMSDHLNEFFDRLS